MDARVTAIMHNAGPGSSVGCASDWYSGGRGVDPPIRQHSSVEAGNEIISTAILALLLIQVGQLSGTGLHCAQAQCAMRTGAQVPVPTCNNE